MFTPRYLLCILNFAFYQLVSKVSISLLRRLGFSKDSYPVLPMRTFHIRCMSMFIVRISL